MEPTWYVLWYVNGLTLTLGFFPGYLPFTCSGDRGEMVVLNFLVLL